MRKRRMIEVSVSIPFCLYERVQRFGPIIREAVPGHPDLMGLTLGSLLLEGVAASVRDDLTPKRRQAGQTAKTFDAMCQYGPLLEEARAHAKR